MNFKIFLDLWRDCHSDNFYASPLYKTSNGYKLFKLIQWLFIGIIVCIFIKITKDCWSICRSVYLFVCQNSYLRLLCFIFRYTILSNTTSRYSARINYHCKENQERTKTLFSQTFLYYTQAMKVRHNIFLV